MIAFGRGGAADIVQPLGTRPADRRPFRPQTVAAVKDAVERFEANPAAITPEACRDNAARFSEENFDRAILGAVGSVQAICDLS